ncbi:hypothetical protein F5B22DRAFT_598171, partial [Xylaria bambusicola]|uniref:uncharacterized protein n=1 Tax=Xylaria bambusicola TaxID=326684 RepID=UPI002008D1DE
TFRVFQLTWCPLVMFLYLQRLYIQGSIFCTLQYTPRRKNSSAMFQVDKLQHAVLHTVTVTELKTSPSSRASW